MRHISPSRFFALSGGSRPAGFVHPLALQALEELGIPAHDLRSKPVEEFVQTPIDICITVCDSASAECPQWPESTITIHWGLPDPVFYEGSDKEQAEFCLGVARRLVRKITQLAALPLDSLPRDDIILELEQLSRL